jgi:hypothetical protein
MSVDSSALEPPPIPDTDPREPKYGGHSRFELELEVRLLVALQSHCSPTH